MKEFSPEELAQFDGSENKPIYIAHQNKVYDVSTSKMWRNGLHMKRHRSGGDLTTDIQAAPHGEDVLERYPQVGILKKSTAAQIALPPALSRLLERFPFLRRHPHPMTVHFPIAFILAAPLFTLLYLVTGVESFETTAWHCLGAGILFTVVAISTGWYTWWLNYFAKPTRAVSIKKSVSLVMLGVEIVVFSWRLAVPQILTSPSAATIGYALLVFSLVPMIIVIGWFGASLTFPVEHE